MTKTCNNPITATRAKIKTLSMNSSTGQTNHALVIGASSGIADALIAQLLQDETLARVTAISRSSCPEKWIDDPRLCWRLSHYDEPAITVISQQLLEQNKITPLHIDRVFIFNGILHRRSTRSLRGCALCCPSHAGLRSGFTARSSRYAE